MVYKKMRKWFTPLIILISQIPVLLAGLTGCTSLSFAPTDTARLDHALGLDKFIPLILDDQWYAMYSEERKVGWRHLQKGLLRHTGQTFQFHIQTTYERYYRYGEAIEKTQVVKMIHDHLNQFVGAAVVSHGGNQADTLAMIRDMGSTLQVTVKQGDTVKKKIIKRQITNLYPLVDQILTMERNVGAHKQFQLFRGEDLSVYTHNALMIRQVKLDLDTGIEDAWRVLVRHNNHAVQDIFISEGDKPRILKIVHHDRPRVFVRMPEVKAKSDLEKYDFNKIHDIKLEKPISSPWGVDTAILDISNERLSHSLVEDSWQVRKENPKDTVTRWLFSARKVDDRQAQYLPLHFKGADAYRNATFYIQTDHPRIRETAAIIKGDETNALRLFRKIAMWVHNSIDKKNYKTNLASAVETLEHKQGDCTEHSFLTAALARAAGIPSRIAMGLYCSGEHFSCHMWVEALVAEDLWAAVDPAMGQIEPDALHLKIYHGDFDINTHSNMTWGLVKSFKPGDLKIVKINQNFYE